MDARRLAPTAMHDLGEPSLVIDLASEDQRTGREPMIGTATSGLLVLAGPGVDERWFVDALAAQGRIQRPSSMHGAGTTAAAARAAIRLPSTLRRWDEDRAASLGDDLDRLGRVRVLVLSRRDLRAAAIVEHANEVAPTGGRPATSAITAEGLDWDRIGRLHDTAHLVLSAWHAEADRRGLPTLDLAHEDAVADARGQVEFVHRWLGLDTRPPGSPARTGDALTDADDLSPSLATQAAAAIACPACDEQATIRRP